MSLAIVAGTANPALAAEIATQLDVPLTRAAVERFPDGELNVTVTDDVVDADAFVVQPLGPPAGDRLVELLLLSDALRAAGASRVSAVVPYLAYARQDRRGPGHTALGAKVIATALQGGHFAHLVFVDLHSPSLEGFFDVPVLHLSAVNQLVDALPPDAARDAVVVAPDLGAVKRAEQVARALRAPMASLQKLRLSGADVSVRSVVGPVAGRRPLIVDDMVVTAGTVKAAADALLAKGCLPEITVAATHLLLVPPGPERMASLPLRHLVTADTLPAPDTTLPLRRVSLAPALARSILELHLGAEGEEAHRVAGEAE